MTMSNISTLHALIQATVDKPNGSLSREASVS